MPSSAEQALASFLEQIGIEDVSDEWLTVDQDQIDAFAETTLDRQFIHIDPAKAALKSPYGVTIAHGFLTLSLISHLVHTLPRAEPDPYAGTVLTINYGLDRVRWPSPVKVNARLRAKRELLSAELKDANTIQLTHKVTVEIDGQAKPACVAEWLTRAVYA